MKKLILTTLVAASLLATAAAPASADILNTLKCGTLILPATCAPIERVVGGALVWGGVGFGVGAIVGASGGAIGGGVLAAQGTSAVAGVGAVIGAASGAGAGATVNLINGGR